VCIDLFSYIASRTHKRKLPDDDVHTSKHVGAVGY
jgi:hypothetical protein